MKGSDYLNHFVLPNFYFHLTAAYAILRHCGVEIGKRDFLGAIPDQDELEATKMQPARRRLHLAGVRSMAPANPS